MPRPRSGRKGIRDGRSPDEDWRRESLPTALVIEAVGLGWLPPTFEIGTGKSEYEVADDSELSRTHRCGGGVSLSTSALAVGSFVVFGEWPGALQPRLSQNRT